MMSSSPVSAQCLCLVWWSYCNLQDHSELISPCAPALIWGVTNWMLINHKAGRKRWPSVRLWACISSRLPRRAPEQVLLFVRSVRVRALQAAKCYLCRARQREWERKTNCRLRLFAKLSHDMWSCNYLKSFWSLFRFGRPITNELFLSKRIFFQ